MCAIVRRGVQDNFVSLFRQSASQRYALPLAAALDEKLMNDQCNFHWGETEGGATLGNARAELYRAGLGESWMLLQCREIAPQAIPPVLKFI